MGAANIGKHLSLATVVIGLGISVVGITARGYSQTWSPSDAEIAKLEAGIKLETLPHWDARLPALTGYARYYAGATMNGELVIFGELVAPIGPYTVGIHIVENRRAFPRIFDGDCGVINLVYSLKQQKLVSIGCNGFA